MIKHPTFQELINIHHDKSTELSQQWKGHLQDCPDCRVKLEKMNDIHGILTNEQPKPSKSVMFSAKAIFIDRILSASSQNWLGKTMENFFRTFLKPMPVAASILVLILVITMLFYSGEQIESPKNNDNPAIATTPKIAGTSAADTNTDTNTNTKISAKKISGKIMAMHGQIFEITADNRSIPLDINKPLIAGTNLLGTDNSSFFSEIGKRNQVLVNSGRLKILKADDLDIHFLLHSGTIASKVAKLEQNQSFIVFTDDFEISVKGTYFAVGKDIHKNVIVAVKEGEVLVIPRDNANNKILVAAGEVLRIDGQMLALKRQLENDAIALSMFSPTNPSQSAVADTQKPAENRKAPISPQKVLDNSENPMKTAPNMAFHKSATLLINARLAQRQGRFEDALILLDDLLNRFASTPEAQDAIYFRGENLLALGQVNEALEIFKNMDNGQTRSDLAQNALYTRAYLLQDRLLKPVKARTLWLRYLNDYPAGIMKEDAAFALCRNYQMTGNHDLAVDSCKEFLANNPKSFKAPQARLIAAHSLFSMRKFADSARLYKDYINKGQGVNLPQALNQLAAAHLKLGETENAVTALKRLIKDFPDHKLSQKAQTILSGLGE